MSTTKDDKSVNISVSVSFSGDMLQSMIGSTLEKIESFNTTIKDSTTSFSYMVNHLNERLRKLADFLYGQRIPEIFGSLHTSIMDLSEKMDKFINEKGIDIDELRTGLFKILSQFDEIVIGKISAVVGGYQTQTNRLLENYESGLRSTFVEIKKVTIPQIQTLTDKLNMLTSHIQGEISRAPPSRQSRIISFTKPKRYKVEPIGLSESVFDTIKNYSQMVGTAFTETINEIEELKEMGVESTNIDVIMDSFKKYLYSPEEMKLGRESTSEDIGSGISVGKTLEEPEMELFDDMINRAIGEIDEFIDKRIELYQNERNKNEQEVIDKIMSILLERFIK